MGWRADANTGAAERRHRPRRPVKILAGLRDFIRVPCALQDFVAGLRIFEIAAVWTLSQNVSNPAGARAAGPSSQT
jgi:hypothetical protein